MVRGGLVWGKVVVRGGVILWLGWIRDGVRGRAML